MELEHKEEINEITVTDSDELFEVEQIMSTGLVCDDSMVRVADITEEFSAVMEPILTMYNAAMTVTTSRIDIIRDEFRYKKKRCPVHHINTRLKSPGSILGKLQKKDLDLTISVACNNIYDIAGVRIVCPYIKDVYLIRDRIMAQDDIEIMNIKDYIQHPKKNGYRSYHMVIRVPVFFMNKKQMVPVEVQIRTLAMDLWASLEHDIRYKAINSKGEYKGDYSEFESELLECSKLIYAAEDKMEKMNELLE
jgi:putative GTP pyrophosphokinase